MMARVAHPVCPYDGESGLKEKDGRMSTQHKAAPDDTVDVITDALLTVSRLMIGLTAQSMAEVDETITVQQFRSMMVLFKRGSTNLTTLAYQMGVQPSAAGRMVDRLVAMGLVERAPHPTSRRELLGSLTPRGHQVVKKINERRRAALLRILGEIPQSTREELVRTLTGFTVAAAEVTHDYDVET
jgi:DNA-binding MarR family transcriptional regulator